MQENKVKVIDATFAIDPKQPKPDWKKFEEEYYGKFDKLINHFVSTFSHQHRRFCSGFHQEILRSCGEYFCYGLQHMPEC